MLLDVPRHYVVLSQQLGTNIKSTVAITDTLAEAKRKLASHVKSRRGIIHPGGRTGRIVEKGCTFKVQIKRRRIDALDKSRRTGSSSRRRVGSDANKRRGRTAKK